MTILVVIMLVATAVVPMISTISDENDTSAAQTSYIKLGEVKIYTNETTDYSRVAYLNDQCPAELDPSEWVRDSGTGLWYNINSSDANYKKVMTYGNTQMSTSQIRQDILAYFNKTTTVFPTSTFQFLQVDLTLQDSTNVNITVTKDGVQLLDATYPMSTTVAGSYIPDVKQYKLLSIEPTNGDIKPAYVRGDYSVLVQSERKGGDTRTVSYSEEDVKFYGKVIDNNANNVRVVDPVATVITNAEITYEIWDTSGAVIVSEKKTKVDPALGKFVISVQKGYVVMIKDVTATGYSFDNKEYSSGKMIADVLDGVTFTANEFTVLVSVSDKATSPLPIANITLESFWYYRTAQSATTYYYQTEAPEAVTPGTASFTANVTDENGHIYLTYTEPKLVEDVEAKLYVKAISTDAYTFKTRTLITGPGGSDWPADEGTGDRYVDLTHTVNELLRSEESSFQLTVTGAAAGPAPISGVRITAKWYYEYLDASSNYVVTDNTSGLSILVPGKANVISSTDAQGHAIVSYSLPELSGATAYLYISSSSTIFTMNCPDTIIGAHAVTLPEYVAGYNGCKALTVSDLTTPSVVLKAEEGAFTINWNISGEVPSYVTVVYYGIGWQSAVKMNAYAVDGEINFSFIMKAGDIPKVTITDESKKYSITNSETILKSVTSDMNEYSVSTLIGDSTYARVDVVNIGIPYIVNGLDYGTVITYTYDVGGDTYKTDVRAVDSDGNGAYKTTFQAKGESGQSPHKDTTVTTTAKVTITSFVKTSTEAVAQASALVNRAIVSYYNETSSVPTLENVRANMKISVYFNGVYYRDFTTGTAGTTTAELPDDPNLKYVYGDKQIVPTLMTSGPFMGYLAFNFNGFIMEDVGAETIRVNIGYKASSSLNNMSEAALTDIVTDLPTSSDVNIGDTVTFIAPEVEGFKFAGWYLNGEQYSDGTNYACVFEADKSMDETVTLYAVYGAVTPQETPQTIDNTVIAIGITAVVIALLAFVYVVFQSKRF